MGSYHPHGTSGAHELASALKEAFSAAKSDDSSKAARIRHLADLKKIAPTFDGEEGTYYFFKQALMGFLRRHQIEDSFAVELAVSVCTAGARRFLSTLGSPQNIDVFWNMLDLRYGEPENLRMDTWRSLK